MDPIWYFIMWGVAILNIMATACCLWRAAQHEKCKTQRLELLEAIYKESARRVHEGDTISWINLYNQMEKVGFKEHLNALVRCQDPYKLYPPYIRRLVKQ